MTVQASAKLETLRAMITCGVSLVVMGTASPVASADPLEAASGAIYKLDRDSVYQHGCFPPCFCPLLEQRGMGGTFKLRYAGLDGSVHKYAVQDVNWAVPFNEIPLRIVGSGVYRIGSPGTLNVLQHRMELDLRIGDESVEHFDSGWIHLEQLSGIHITLSMNDLYCWDTALYVHASRVPNDAIRPYSLVAGSTFQRGCWDPCDCLLGPELPMIGTFDLVMLEKNSFFIYFAVVDVRWGVRSTSLADSIPITGFGTYQLPAGFAIQQRLALDLVVGAEERTHYDSGSVVGGSEFPKIDVVVSIHGMECFDTVLHVVAKPQEGKTCGGIAGIPCDDGEFCKLPLGDCCCDFFGACTPFPDACPTVLDPVCGCDGVTYGNECDAAVAGVSIDHFGPCGEPCASSADCPAADQFCKFREGTCGETAVGGVCTPVPGACPRIYDPVCGCDGVTYGNECEADNARVSVAHRGPCKELCSDMLGMIPCAGDKFCLYPEGTCDDGVHPGVCTPKPEACPEIYEPVCGCDGRTYDNKCFAYMAGVSIDHPGACERVCRKLDTTLGCGSDEFCKFPPGACDDGDALGICTPIPNACPEIYEPVCGCDGKTYGNECLADKAGVSVDYPGECRRVCGGFTGNQCEQGEFCKFPLGICSDAVDHSGVCTPIPDACPEVYAPVCGCDGVTYGNACEADAAAVSILHLGRCEDQPCAATRVLGNSTNTFTLASYCPGIPFAVRIVLTPPDVTTTIGIEDTPPAGWVVTNISHDGTFDSVNGKVKWGPLFAPFPSHVSYVVTPVSSSDARACFTGAISLDGLNDRICDDQCLVLFCRSFMAADLPQQACTACAAGDCTSCGDDVCNNGMITLCEVIGYACAWMTGCNDDLAGMTRAAYVWRNGECYCRDDAQENWFPSPCPPPASGFCPNDGAAANSPMGGVASSAATAPLVGGVESVAPVQLDRVPRRDRERTGTITIEASQGTSVVALDVHVPNGWRVTAVSDGGAWDELHRKVKWGPLFEDLSRTVTFTVRRSMRNATPTHPRLSREPRVRGFTGTVSFDGINQSIAVEW